jgi:mannan endo-1,4-beta-mannosidase
MVTVYEDANFQGESAALGVGRYDWEQIGIANDSLSSLKVPPGWAATLYEDVHFGGRSKIFTHDASYVGDDFNDLTSSIVVANTSTGGKALNFLRNISGLRTVAGQHNREPNSAPAKWTNVIHDTCGKFPGLWSGDFLYEQDNIDNRWTMINEAKNQWGHGALINLMYHAAPPNQGEPCGWEGGVLSHLSDDEWNQLITDGSDLNNKWKARLDVISVFFQDLKDNGVEALWRPFHEMNQGNFWWGGRPGPQGTARLYQITHDYMVGTKGLTNLTWVWDVQDLDFNWAPYNPGERYWDILAMDMYGDGYTTQKYETLLQLAGDKPIAIGECKILPTAQELAAQPRWTFFMAWAELVFSDDGVVTNSVQQIKDLYAAATVMIRDQMPGWG